MSLTASERRTLSGIERVLQSRDPHLRSLFSIFTRLTWQEAMPAREQLLRKRGRRWHFRPWPAMAFPLACLLVAAIITTGAIGGLTSRCLLTGRLRAGAGSLPSAR